jgi:CDP-paratose 2-epimerase
LQILDLPKSDWVIDCAANPSVMAGIHGDDSQAVMDHNLVGTIHVAEYCKKHGAGLVLVSTSRVYSVHALTSIPCQVVAESYQPDFSQIDSEQAAGLTVNGIGEEFSTRPPLSLYGVSKLASELIAQEYSSAFGFPLWINRCGVMAGDGQFGRADQGIVAFWLNSYLRERSLTYIGFDGLGHQTRDCLHPRDLWTLIQTQIETGGDRDKPTVVNVSGGCDSAFSLRSMTEWCARRWGVRSEPISSEPSTRRFDVPWIVLDSSLARRVWGWSPQWTTP